MLRVATLRTAGMFDGHDPQDADFDLWKSIAEYMDGETALVIDSYAEKGKYVFLGLTNSEKYKELSYMMEQDSMTGAFINDREVFEEMWETGEYYRDEYFYLEENCLEFPTENAYLVEESE